MENWKFENIDWFWALNGIWVLLLLFWFRRRQKRRQLSALGGEELRQRLMPEYSSNRSFWKNAFMLLALAFLTVALANPQTGAKVEKVKIKGADIIIALDVSNSMLAEDISPNRLEKAKMDIIQLLGKMKNDRVGFIIFAGKAFIPVPLTTDYAMIKMYLRGIDTDIISTQGTDVGEAISLAMGSFSEDKKTDKALIIITDGEDHEQAAVDMAKKAKEAGITVHTIGMGSKDGVPLPMVNRFGRKEFLKDKHGNVVVTKINEQLLNEIAAAGKGQYVLANSQRIGLEKIYEELKGMEKSDFEEKTVINYEDDFQFYLWFVLAFLLLDQLILPKKNKLLSRIKISEVKI